MFSLIFLIWLHDKSSLANCGNVLKPSRIEIYREEDMHGILKYIRNDNWFSLASICKTLSNNKKSSSVT